MKRKIRVGLYEGEFKVKGIDDYIFKKDFQKMDFLKLEEIADAFIKTKNKEFDEVELVELFTTNAKFHFVNIIDALVSVINAACKYNMTLVLFYHDKDTDTYRPQLIYNMNEDGKYVSKEIKQELEELKEIEKNKKKGRFLLWEKKKNKRK